jgi:uroporphyrinogen decarboxylase
MEKGPKMNRTPEIGPDYTQIASACRNRGGPPFPLYEHNVSIEVVEALLGRPLADLAAGDETDKVEFFRTYAGCLASLGYDTVPFEGCVTELIQGGEALCGRAGALVKTKADIEAFDWDGTVERYIERFGPSFRALARALPPGMKAHGGVGNGVFETVQDFVPLTDIAYLQIDDPDAWALLVTRVGDLMDAIWARFLAEFGDSFAFFRFGDDLGFQTSVLIQPSEIVGKIIPQYKRVIDRARSTGKPFLLHSCGAITPVMNELISAGIDAKHSNEDNIAPFEYWSETYGERIGNFGGVDMNVLCTFDEKGISEYVRDLKKKIVKTQGIAWGSGNQITDYTPPENFLAMVRAFRDPD